MATRVLRHGLRTRVLHALNALALLVLLTTGLALGDWLPASIVAAVGGHDAIDGVHRWLGLGFVGAAILACVLWRASARWLARQFTRWHRREWRWPLDYLYHALAPARRRAPSHDGYFDPLERLVLSLLLLAVIVAGVSGVYLFWLPPAPLWVFLVMIRAHVGAAWVAIALLCIHIVAGLGVLPSHRGIARAMFGDGTVPEATARRLWPAWAEKVNARGTKLRKTSRRARLRKPVG